MNLRVVFRPQAERELLEAERWYEERKAGLGQQFRAALDGTMTRVGTLPLSFPLVHGDKRRALVPRFPYGLYFSVVDDDVVVVGVLHARRDPEASRSRR